MEPPISTFSLAEFGSAQLSLFSLFHSIMIIDSDLILRLFLAFWSPIGQLLELG